MTEDKNLGFTGFKRRQDQAIGFTALNRRQIRSQGMVLVAEEYDFEVRHPICVEYKLKYYIKCT